MKHKLELPTAPNRYLPVIALLGCFLLAGCDAPSDPELTVAPTWTATEASLAPPELEEVVSGGATREILVQQIQAAHEDRSATHFVQAPASQDAPLSPSDRAPIEVVPTPVPRPEIDAEIIPTPQGIPAGAMSSKPPANRIADKGIGIKAKSPDKPALIDPETEVGLTAGAPEDFRQWETPEAVLFVTGDQYGYIEPCGCTGLDKQKGGVARRMTFIKELQKMSWPLIPIDSGGQIRRIGQQAAIKFSWSSEALKQMGYRAVGIGATDMRLSATDLIQAALEAENYVAGNIVLIDPSFVPSHKIVTQGERTVGITSILDPAALDGKPGPDVTVQPPKEAAQKVLGEMNAAGADFRVITFFGEEPAAKKLMADVPGYDLIVVSGGYGEPTYRAEPIEGSDAKIILTGHKGMYAGLVALYPDKEMKYARVPLTHEFGDAPEMRKLMADYQKQLEGVELSGLGISPIPHPSGGEFVGTKRCGECHTKAMDVWEFSAHADATDHIVKPPKERGDIARHFDPECISCHVTGWNPQDYYPYATGYVSLDASAHLHGNGCENCHGPGKEHADAEDPNSGVSDERKKSLRLAMQLPLERAKEHCMKCHDLDNSPAFHDENAFEDEYWPQVEHEGVD